MELINTSKEEAKKQKGEDKKELKKIEAWLDEQNKTDDYLEKNGHAEW